MQSAPSLIPPRPLLPSPPFLHFSHTFSLSFSFFSSLSPGEFYRETTLQELKGAWESSIETIESEERFPVWEYYSRERSFGSQPALTNLTSPDHRKCNYNLHFQGKPIEIFHDDLIMTSSQPTINNSSSRTTIDCGISHQQPGASLDFPRRGFIVQNGGGSSIGPGIVVQNCSVMPNKARLRSMPGTPDTRNGGGILIMNRQSAETTDITSDGVTLSDVTIINCGAFSGGGLFIGRNNKVKLMNVTTKQCYGMNGPAMHIDGNNIDVEWVGGAVTESSSLLSGAIQVTNGDIGIKLAIEGVRFEDNMQRSTPATTSGRAVMVNSNDVDILFKKCIFRNKHAGMSVYLGSGTKSALFDECTSARLFVKEGVENGAVKIINAVVDSLGSFEFENLKSLAQ